MECRYYSPTIRCYSDGRIERILTRNGKVLGAGKWREVKQTCFDKDGYLLVSINGKQERWHRVIWEAFNGKIPDGLTINHKDETHDNNAIDNLELLTAGDNDRYGTRIKRIADKKRGQHTKKRKRVLCTNIETGETMVLECMSDGVKYGFSIGCISMCCKGVYLQHKGYTFEIFE